MSECVFCNKNKIITDFVYEDNVVMAFMDMEPINEGMYCWFQKNITLM